MLFSILFVVVGRAFVTRYVNPDTGLTDHTDGLGWWYGLVAVYLLYFPVMWGLLGGTIGQKLLGISVVRAANGRRAGLGVGFLRLLGYLIASIPFSLGLMWAGWDARKQGWHDKIASTLVVRRL